MRASDLCFLAHRFVYFKTFLVILEPFTEILPNLYDYFMKNLIFYFVAELEILFHA